jgi:hypothetical protein
MFPRAFLLAAASAVFCGGPESLAADSPIERAVHATFKVTGKDSTATCFLLNRPGADKGKAETILVTAGHTLEKISGDEARLILRDKDGDKGYKRKEQVIKVRAAGKPLWVKHPQVDVAALRVEVPPETAAQALPLDRLAGESAFRDGRLSPGDDVWVLCYPAQFEVNGAGFPVTRKGAIASFPLVPVQSHQTFLLDYNTFGGDSGAPVLTVERVPALATAGEGPQGVRRREPLVIGLVLAQVRHSEKVTLIYEERVIHHRLGLAIAISSEFIRQTVDKVPQGVPGNR